MKIRLYRPDDLPALKQITVEAFDGVSIDHAMEQNFGLVRQHDWKWRKARHLEVDVERDPTGVFVCEAEGRIVGYITTWQDREAGLGHIPNLALVPACRGRGWGRLLIEHALAHFRRCGLSHAKIETLAHNDAGQHLYPSLGFREVARQIHYVAALDVSDQEE